MSKKLMIAVLLLVAAPLGVANAGPTTVTDDFSVAHNYNDGAPFGIWWGGWNTEQLGAGTLASDGTVLNMANVGVNYGWEGGRSNAPMLYYRIPAGQANMATFGSAFDFQATVKITQQTSGNWSNVAIIARTVSADAPSGTAGGTNGDEDFTTAASFVVGAGAAGTQRGQKLINNGGQQIDATGPMVGFAEPLPGAPVWLRLERRTDLTNPARKRFFFSASADGTTFFDQTSALPDTDARDLNNANTAMDIGLSFHTFGTLVGTAAVDDFSLTFPGDPGVPPQPCVECTWNVNGSGNWVGAGNWVGPAAAVTPSAPNFNTKSAVFGAVVTPGPQTVYANQTITIKELRFDGPNKYVIAGTGTISLDADAGNAKINVNGGSHEIQIALSLADNVDVTTAAGTTLAINAPITLNGKTFNIGGAGTFLTNNGTIAAGTGDGSVVNGGSLAGLSSVEGDLTQTGEGSLSVMVGDSPISVTGAAVLGGSLDVSLAPGVSPVNGQSYTVLTADSVTNAGLSLNGSAAGLFRLSVGGGSVTLTAVPEPGTLVLFGFGLGAVGLTRVRRRQVRGFFLERSMAKHLRVTCIALFAAAAALWTSVSSAQAPANTLPSPAHLTLNYTRYDLFGDDTMPQAAPIDYATLSGGGAEVALGTFNPAVAGTVSGSTIWAKILNGQNGGDIVSPGSLCQDCADGGGNAKPGRLVIEDFASHANTTAGQLGVGYEGDKSNAPALVTTIDAAKDFDAFARVTAQYAGQWSLGGILVRLEGPVVGKNVGDGLDPLESNLAVGSFRTDAANVGNAVLHAERNNNGNGQGDQEIGMPPNGAAGAIPFLMRISKRGTIFTWASCSAATDCTNNANWTASTGDGRQTMGAAGATLQVGPTYMRFVNPAASGAGLRPNTEFDWFQLNVYDPSLPLVSWNVNASGDWVTDGNWLPNYTGVASPNANDKDVTFGGAITTPQTVFTNSNVTVKSLTFANAQQYQIAGAGRITLDSNTGNTSITVTAGSHKLSTPVTVADPAAITMTGTTTRLDLNNEFNFSGQTLTVSGTGRVFFNNNIDTPNGTVTSTGNIGGSGRINGNVTQTAGAVAPGSSVGTLTVDGTMTESGAVTNRIEMGGTGAGTFDKLVATGAATITGTVDVTYVAGFLPSVVGTTWDIATGSTLASTAVLDPVDAPSYSLTVVSGNILRLTLTAPLGVFGDYNGDGTVNAADYTVWKNAFAAGATTILNRQNGSSGAIAIADFTFWKGRYGAVANGAGSGSVLGGGTSVPEPTSMMLMLAAVLGACGVYRRHR